MTLKVTSFGDNTNNNLISGFSFLPVVVFCIQFLNLYAESPGKFSFFRCCKWQKNMDLVFFSALNRSRYTK